MQQFSIMNKNLIKLVGNASNYILDDRVIVRSDADSALSTGIEQGHRSAARHPLTPQRQTRKKDRALSRPIPPNTSQQSIKPTTSSQTSLFKTNLPSLPKPSRHLPSRPLLPTQTLIYPTSHPQSTLNRRPRRHQREEDRK